MNEVKLYTGDCLQVMQDNIKDESIDLTVTSPPYDDLRSYKNNIDKSWGEHIWKPIIKELYRVIKTGGVVVWIVSDGAINGSESGTSFKQALWAMECGFNLYDTMIWEKPSPQSPTEGRYYDVFEYMFVFSKGKPKSLNLIVDRKNISHGSKAKKETRSNREDREYKEGVRVVKEYSRRFNVWSISRGKNNTSHPAVFPEKLANDHIISWSNEGDTIFDPFLGSGTTGKMAVVNGRKFIGCDISEEYIAIAEKRIKEAESNKQLTLF